MKRNRINILLILFLLLSSCGSQDKPSASTIRIADFLLPDHPVKVQLSGTEDRTIDLIYGEATSPVQVREGSYMFRVIDENEKVIIEQNLGIGKQTNCTITVTGILLPSDSRKNQKTLKTKLREAAEGASAYPANAAMPILSIFLDRFEGDPQKAKLKAVHMAPGLNELDLFVMQKGKMKKLTSLEYPRPSEREYALAPGNHKVEIRYKFSDVVLYEGDLSLEAGKLTTLFVYGNPKEYPYRLKVNAMVYED